MPNGKSGGKGGKTEAIYYLKKGDILHIWVGGQGYSDGTGGFNGGGTGEKIMEPVEVELLQLCWKEMGIKQR